MISDRLQTLLLWKQAADSDKERNRKIDQENMFLRASNWYPKDMLAGALVAGTTVPVSAPLFLNITHVPDKAETEIMRKLMALTSAKLVTEVNSRHGSSLQLAGPHYNPDENVIAVPSKRMAQEAAGHAWWKKYPLPPVSLSEAASKSRDAENEAWRLRMAKQEALSDKLRKQTKIFPGEGERQRQNTIRERLRRVLSYDSHAGVNKKLGQDTPGVFSGVLAHEVGHSQQAFMKSKLFQRIYDSGRKTVPVASLLATMALKDEDQARNAAIAGVVGGAPMVAIEADASLRGARLLRKVNPKGSMLQDLKPFAGVGTYGAAATGPLLLWYIRKLMGRYKTPES